MADQTEKKNGLPDIQTIVELGPAVVYHCNEYWEYGINYISPNVTNMLGWLPDDFLDDAEFRHKLIHKDDFHDLLIDLTDLYEQGQQKHEYRLCHKNGHYVWVSDEVRCLYDDDGKVIGIVGYLSDITQSKNKDRYLKESELRYRAIFETVLEGIITIDEQGIIQDMNRISEDIFGYNRTELIGRNVSMLMPSPDAENHDEYLRKYMAGGVRTDHWKGASCQRLAQRWRCV
ncbi:MAG: PAS domain S-box protein [Methylocystaceae bacterium]|nr:PAS domain S-box protein [Methylocystaceae bacterium]